MTLDDAAPPFHKNIVLVFALSTGRITIILDTRARHP
jgi:hypothetical protein